MRIAQVITLGHEIYGAQKHVLGLVTSLKKDGHDVLVIVGTVGALTDACTSHGIEWRCIKSLQRAIRPWKDIKACFELKAALKEFKPDIVASHSSKAGLVARWVCYRMGIPNTFTAHGWSFEDGVPPMRRMIFKFIEKLAGSISCKIIVVAKVGKQLALDEKVASESKLEVIYNGTDDLGSQHAKNQQQIFTMSMVAGIREQKDHRTLIEACKGISDLEWQLWLFGDGPLQPEMEALVSSYGLDDKIFFKGMVDNVPEHLAQTDLLVLISNWEGLPISILEGLSLRLPVVATDVSGVREQVIDGFNGTLVQRGDAADVEKALRDLLNDPQKLAEYSKNSRQLYLDTFTHEVMYQKTSQLYADMIADAKDS